MSKLVKVSLVRFHSIIKAIIERYPNGVSKSNGSRVKKKNFIASRNLYTLTEIYEKTFPDKTYNFRKSKYQEYIRLCSSLDNGLVINSDLIIGIVRNQLNYIAKLYLEDDKAEWEDLNSLFQPVSFLNSSYWEFFFIKCINEDYYLAKYYISFEGRFCNLFGQNNEQYIGLYEIDSTTLNCYVNFQLESRSGRYLYRNLMVNAIGTGDGNGTVQGSLNSNNSYEDKIGFPSIKYVEGILSGNSLENTLIANIILMRSISKSNFDTYQNKSTNIKYYSKSYNSLIQEDFIIHSYFKETHINRIRTSGNIIYSEKAIQTEIKNKNRLTYPLKRKIYISAPNGSTDPLMKKGWIKCIEFIKSEIVKRYSINDSDIFSKILDLESSNMPTGENHYVEPIETHRSAFISIVLLPFGLSTSAFVEACWSCLYNKNHFENPVKPTLVILDEKYKKDTPSFFNNSNKTTVTMPVTFTWTNFLGKDSVNFNQQLITDICIDFLTKYRDNLNDGKLIS